jgi:hypothetical protein
MVSSLASALRPFVISLISSTAVAAALAEVVDDEQA